VVSLELVTQGGFVDGHQLSLEAQESGSQHVLTEPFAGNETEVVGFLPEQRPVLPYGSDVGPQGGQNLA
jgi:hypothetical protein